MSIGEKTENLISTMQSLFFAKPASHYIELETSDNQSSHALVTPTGSLVSIVEVSGARSFATGDWTTQAVENLSQGYLKTVLDQKGHTMQWVFSYDPNWALHDATEAINPYRESASKLGAEMDEMLVDTAKAVGRYTANEKIYIALWTKPELLPSGEVKIAKKDRANNIKKTPQDKGAQNISAIISSLRDRHDSFVMSIIDALSNAGIDSYAIGQHEACWVQRKMLDPKNTSANWRALLPGDPLPARLDWAKKGELEFLYPSLPDQLMPRQSENIDQKIIRIGDTLHKPIIVNLPPQTPRIFQSIFARLIQIPFPWRISQRLSGDGIAGLQLKHTISYILRLTSQESKQFHNAMNERKDAEIEGETNVRLQIELDTWVDANQENAMRQLLKQSERLVSAVQSWGAADTSDIIGDPLLGATCTVPGLTPGSPAPAAAAPIQDAVKMLPIGRPAKIWEFGLPTRSTDGKLLPLFPGSSKQNAWIELFAGPLGTGKSVTANAINLAHFLNPNVDEAPYLTILDIGQSSAGLHEMIVESFPPHKQHVAGYKKLKNRTDSAINPCDTFLGCEYPFDIHFEFLVNFICLLATPSDMDTPPDGISGLASRCVDRAYLDKSYNAQPNIYMDGISTSVDQALKKIGFQPEPETSWWTITRVLYNHELYSYAAEAQKYAVPTINDIAQYANDESIAQPYRDSIHDGKPLPNLFYRLLLESINKYPILSGVTKTDTAISKSVILDLDEVAKGSDRQAAVMYMLAFHAGTNHLFVQPEDIESIPDAYKPYHRERFNKLRSIPKRIYIDEFHRVSRNELVKKIFEPILTRVSRESRKWNIHVALASQSIDDFDDVYMQFATSFYVLGATLASAKLVEDKLQLPAGSANAISKLRSPSRAGNEFFSVIYTKSGDPVVNKQMLTLGGEITIGLDSNAWTSTVRRNLSRKIGPSPARRLIARNYPSGIAEELEKRGLDLETATTDNDNSMDMVEKITNELLEQYNKSLEDEYV